MYAKQPCEKTSYYSTCSRVHVCVGAGNTVGRGKVSVDYWTTSRGDNKRPSGGGEGRGQINEIWMCLLDSCRGSRPTDGLGDIKNTQQSSWWLHLHTAATPAIFRHCSLISIQLIAITITPQKLSSSRSSSPFPSSPSPPVHLHYRFHRATESRRCRKLKLARSINTI